MDWLLLALYFLSGASQHPTIVTANMPTIAPSIQSLKFTTAHRIICAEPMDRGNCSQRIVRYFYNAASNRCRKFIYSGCGGNENRFETRAECRRTCARLKGPRSAAIAIATTATHWTPENECSNCDKKHALCVDGRCQCVNGFYGDGAKCEDINECEGGYVRCPENAYCINTIGSFKCECQLGYAGSGTNCTKNSAVCSQKFDKRYEGQCTSSGQWEIRYYYDTESMSCKRFWYGGCTSSNLNIFADAQSCEAICVHRSELDWWWQMHDGDATTTIRSEIADICSDAFDVSLRKACITLSWQPRFFYNESAQRCQMFWYDESCEASGRTRNIFGYLSTCRRLCESLTKDRNLRYRSKPKTIGKITAMFTRDRLNATTPSDRTMANSADMRTNLPRFVVSAKLTDYPTTTSDARIEQRQQVTYASPIVFEAASTRLPIRLGKISVTYNEYSEGEERSLGEMQDLRVSTTANTFGFESHTSTMHPNKIEENMMPPFGDTMDENQQLASSSDLGDVLINTVAGSDVQPKKDASDSEIDLDEGDVSKFDIGQQFSLQFATAVAVAVDCLDSFDINLTRSCGYGEWTVRYYFNADTRSCQMFWNDGCRSLSRNNFDDLATCQWKCEGTHPKPQSRSCLDTFDPAYLGDCRNGYFEKRYYFNHDKKRCELIYFGGCPSTSRNFFSDFGECQDLCESPSRELIRSCLQPFDREYERQCSSDGRYKIQYYYDIERRECRMFWYGNCRGLSENIFPTLATCQWICERRKDDEAPKHCIDKFDSHYAESCGAGAWIEKWYFDHNSGLCRPFWYDGCVSSSQNIFNDRETCQWLCEIPTLPSIAEATSNDAYRCLEDKSPGMCKERYPAYYYNKERRRCEPFAYTGCGGNGNRFLTLQQCQSTCNQFRRLSPLETDCYLPLTVGNGRGDVNCQKNAGFRYYYNKDYGRCGKFWYFGCGGNGNRFYTYSSCDRVCRRTSSMLAVDEPGKPSVCFLPREAGKCAEGARRAQQRWAYNSEKLKCEPFTYSGCGGNENRFASEYSCKSHCGGLIRPNSAQCAYYPDWGPCNQLRYMWFYNMTRGTCDQFLWGGCEGNTNRFPTFELCQVTCEVPGIVHDICTEPLDRGRWCQPMSNRYYFNKKSNACKGFHYTGCGLSANNFLTLRECEDKCVKGRRGGYMLSSPTTSSSSSKDIQYLGKKPREKRPMIRHQILSGDQNAYIKTEGQWVEYGHCLGFRYNISGQLTRLNNYLCLMEEEGTCQMQTLTDTHGEERCRLMRPWLRGFHFYSWFFTVDRRPQKRSDPQRRIQKANETIATIIILPINDCYSIC